MDEQKDKRETEPEEPAVETGEKEITEQRRGRKVALIFTLVLGLALPALLFGLGVAIDSGGFFGLFLVFAMLSLLCGIIALIVFCRLGIKRETRSEKKEKVKSAIPYLAFAAELCAAPVFFLGFFTPVVGGLFILLGALAPLAGTVLGIVAINLEKEQLGIVGKIFALISIFLPILTVLVFVILFSTGVLVFALM